MNCDTWVDLSQHPLPRPFRNPKLDDAYRKIRSDRQKFKDVRVVPNELPLFFPSTESPASVTAVSGSEPCATPEHDSNHSAKFESTMSREEKEAIFRTVCNEMVLSPDGLREILRTNPNSDLGIDSLMTASIISQICEFPSLRTGISAVDFLTWLPRFMLRHGHILNDM